MNEIKYTIKTTMDKEDYRKFLYLATFCRNKMVVPIIAIIALAGSLLTSLRLHSFTWGSIALLWILFFSIAIGVICFKVERKNKLRIASDNTGTFGSQNVIKFYEDKVVMENDSLKSTAELKYAQFFSVVESKDYFIFYLTANQASLIRKRDVTSPHDFKEFLTGIFQDKYKHM